MVWPSNLCLQWKQQLWGFKIDIYNKWFKNFPNNVFETARFWWIVNLTAVLHLLQRKSSPFLVFIGCFTFITKEKFPFSLICSFCWLFYIYYKGKAPLFFNLWFLLLLTGRVNLEFQKSKSGFGINTSNIPCMPIFSQNWHTWYIEDPDSYSDNSFLNCLL